MRLVLRPGVADGEHLIVVDGVERGSVIKRTTHYNLIRSFTSIYYVIRLDGHHLRDQWGEAERFERLKDARTAIIEEIQK